jgi:hypothetical protein
MTTGASFFFPVGLRQLPYLETSALGVSETRICLSLLLIYRSSNFRHIAYGPTWAIWPVLVAFAELAAGMSEWNPHETKEPR